jgi:hypothetical protein
LIFAWRRGSEPFLEREQDLADAEQADHRDQEVEAGEQVRRAEGEAQRAGDGVGADRGEREAEHHRAMVLNGGSLLVPMNAQKVSR